VQLGLRAGDDIGQYLFIAVGRVRLIGMDGLIRIDWLIGMGRLIGMGWLIGMGRLIGMSGLMRV